MRIAWVICLHLVLCSASLFAQRVTFTRIPPPRNSPYTLIGGMAQDSLGYMWFISGGVLYRYDGYDFKTYTNDALDTNSISAVMLECIHIDRDGIIWLGDQYVGLISFDPGKGKFRQYRYDSTAKSGLASDHISVINEDDDGQIWIGTPAGLNVFDKKTGQFKLFRNDPSDPGSISHNDINSIYKDKSGTMWVGTGGAFYTNVMDLRGGLNRLIKKQAHLKDMFMMIRILPAWAITGSNRF